MEKKKKIIIIGIIIAITLVAFITVLLLNRQEDNESVSKTEPTILDISQVFEIDDIEKSKYEIEKTKDIQISSKKQHIQAKCKCRIYGRYRKNVLCKRKL